jgi:hypothetical protein
VRSRLIPCSFFTTSYNQPKSFALRRLIDNAELRG